MLQQQRFFFPMSEIKEKLKTNVVLSGEGTTANRKHQRLLTIQVKKEN
jgi:hypothetical protein